VRRQRPAGGRIRYAIFNHPLTMRRGACTVSAREGLQPWNGDLRTDVRAAVTSLKLSDDLLVRVSVNRLQVVTHLLK
jgi:hypothetical protein